MGQIYRTLTLSLRHLNDIKNSQYNIESRSAELCKHWSIETDLIVNWLKQDYTGTIILFSRSEKLDPGVP